MCLKLNSIVGEQFSRMNFTLSCEACFLMASWNANSSTPSGSPSLSPIEMKYLFNTSATSCGRERIQSSSRNYLVSAPIGILIREKWLYWFKKFLIPILRIASQLKIGFNRLLVQFYDFVSKLHIHRSVFLIAPISEMFPPPYIAHIQILDLVCHGCHSLAWNGHHIQSLHLSLVIASSILTWYLTQKYNCYRWSINLILNWQWASHIWPVMMRHGVSFVSSNI